LPTPDLTGRVVYFPVRHHSPACAWHVDRLIRELRPEAVLIEGPRDATPLVPLLLETETQMPVAVYATYVRRRDDGPPERSAAYYPLCDYSPEWAAVKAATEVGAAVKFIDLTYPEMVEARRAYERQVASLPKPDSAAGPAADQSDADQSDAGRPDKETADAGKAKPAGPAPRTESLQDESWITHSRLLRAACVRTGARDPDDLWDLL